MLRAIGVALLWIVSFPLAILYHLLRSKPKGPKLYTPGTREHARMVAGIEARMAAARKAQR